MSGRRPEHKAGDGIRIEDDSEAASGMIEVIGGAGRARVQPRSFEACQHAAPKDARLEWRSL